MKMIETQRLLLRNFFLDDIGDFFEYISDPCVTSPANFLPCSNKDKAKELLQTYIQNNDIWAVALKDDGKVIGQIKIYPDNNRGKYTERNSAKFINYMLSSKHWRNGYATEALQAVVKYIFEETNCEILTAFHFENNTASRRVLEKCGFQYEVTLENGILGIDGKYYPGVYHSILIDTQQRRENLCTYQHC